MNYASVCVFGVEFYTCNHLLLFPFYKDKTYHLSFTTMGAHTTEESKREQQTRRQGIYKPIKVERDD